jgi:hypothetical protein
MARVNVHDIGDLVRITGTLETADGTNVDPTTLVCKVENAAGTVTTYTYGVDAFPVRTEAGVYYVDYTPTVPGSHYYKFTSTGTGQAADEGRFVVRPSEVA